MFQVHFVHLTTEHQSSAVQHTVDCAGWELWICDAVQYHVSEWYYILLAQEKKSMLNLRYSSPKFISLISTINLKNCKQNNY